MTVNKPVRILAWPDERSAGKNPYVGLMYGAFRSGLADILSYKPLMFRVPQADVFHIQWPEGVFSGASGGSILVCRIKIWRTLKTIEYVRSNGGILALTIHNLAPHRELPYRQASIYHKFYSRLLSLTDVLINLSEDGRQQHTARHKAALKAANEVIPHPHYRNSYHYSGDKTNIRKILSIPDGLVVGMVGSIRRSKQIPAAIETFRNVCFKDEHLLVSGGCDDDRLWEEIIAARGDSQNIILRRAPLSDKLLSQSIMAIDICLINQEVTLNSGTALLALSFNVPLIAPAVGSLPELQKAVGKEWVQLFPTPLFSSSLRSSIDLFRDTSRGPTAPLDIYRPETLSQRLFDVFSVHLSRRRQEIVYSGSS